MAEATDRPQVPADAVMANEPLGVQTPAPTETYQALSLLAMAGFGLAAIYALVVLIGSAVALVGRIPWLMPYWTFLIPIAVLIVCWAARTRILNSEGTLSGLAFTTWGSRLAILFTIPYAAYYLATFLAVRSPAIDCANEFLQRIKEGRLDQAFLAAQPDISIKGMNSKAMRDEIESRFNQPMGAVAVTPGAFSHFRQENFVRFIEMDGEQVEATPTGVDFWEYGKGGYRVILNYHIATSLVEFDMKVDTFGRDPKPGEPKGRRQWQVHLQRSATATVPGSMKLTKRGEDFEKRTSNAQKFASEWVYKINDVDKLQPGERESYSKLIRGYETFWASKLIRDEISESIRKMFQPRAGEKRFNLFIQPGTIPFLRESNGRTTGAIDVMIRYYEEGNQIPQFLVDGRLMLSADSNVAADAPSAWRVDALEIESGRTSPERRRMQKGLEVPTPAEAGPENPRNAPTPLPPPKLRTGGPTKP